jgi:prepilin-type N-terminal cleavage/methylation domain-containing protein
MRTQQSGFTLVEIAIVLVIIGLLLGGVLKGQELINSAKAKAVISDFRNTATMMAAYQDRFRALPGDDAAVATHLTNGQPATTFTACGAGGAAPGISNGLIDGCWNSITPTDESVVMWQHLRLANLASGDTTAPTAALITAGWLPLNAEGGPIGVQSTPPFTGMTGRMFVCQGNISGRIAQQVDSTMDDGRPDQGSVRFGVLAAPPMTAATVGGATPTFSENSLYVICASF